MNEWISSNLSNALKGNHGKILIKSDASTTFQVYGECTSWSLTGSSGSEDLGVIGSNINYAVDSGLVSYTLAVEELLIRDDVTIAYILEQWKQGLSPSFAFQSSVPRADGTEQRIALSQVVPVGEMTILNLTPGQVCKRTLNFRVNIHPEFLSQLS